MRSGNLDSCDPPPATALELRASLGARSFGPFVEPWEPVRNRYKDLFEFCRLIACVLPTSSAAESDFSRLGGAKTG
jgi:hypothetical protein